MGRDDKGDKPSDILGLTIFSLFLCFHRVPQMAFWRQVLLAIAVLLPGQVLPRTPGVFLPPLVQEVVEPAHREGGNTGIIRGSRRKSEFEVVESVEQTS